MTSSPDAFRTHAPTPGTPARAAWPVTPADETDLSPYAKALYVGTAGDLTLIPAGGAEAVTLKNHPVGYVAVQARRVLATGTTAEDIVALSE
ncbi:hypothetical protein [Brevundimonas sp.]|uniref:spike base protein, RCAP_Rcc01079 family n=1 Tax=Brevundimonas sp. TaxID=1871086 RepID=UPI001D398AE6|nr:hypothetical protein [Brevundimonas sp.]MBL0948338.1 hypothetical protein [Brevundimonas sp.]